MFPWKSVVIAAGALFLLATTGRAQAVPATAGAPAAADTGARLSLDSVLATVVSGHPELAAATARAEAARQRPAQENSLPDPMLSTGYTSTGRPWPGVGLGSDPNASVGFMVSQTLPYSGKRQRRSDLATREADAERQQIEAVRLSLQARAKQAYYRLAAAYQLDDVLRRNQELLTALLQVSESRYAVGQAAQQDVIRTQTQVSLLALQRERIARERRTRQGELNALMNRPPETPLGQPSDLAPLTLATSLESLVTAANQRSPTLLRDRLMVARADAAIRVAEREFKPDFAISGGYYYMGEMPDMYEARVDLNIPLQRARRKAAVAERQIGRSAALQDVESTRLTLQSRLQEDFQIATTAGRLATLYRETVLPQARLALESSVASYQTGAVDFLSVLTNFGSVLEYEMSYIEQLIDLHVAAVRLEEMAAVTLIP